MISTPDRRQTIALIEPAVAQGASLHKACEVPGISARTCQRWTCDGGVKADAYLNAERPVPPNRLAEAGPARILAVCNQPEYSHLPPSQIVPILARPGRIHRLGIELLPGVARGRPGPAPRASPAADPTCQT